MTTVLVTAASSTTAASVVPELLARGFHVRGLARRNPGLDPRVEVVLGDMDDPGTVRAAVDGVDAVVHIGPPLHPREIAMGQSVIDAARAASVDRFVLFSVIHPQIDDLVNHQAKLAVEAHLVHHRLDWTILQPQHYMQVVDVPRAVATGTLALPYSTTQSLCLVDLADVAEVAATVLADGGHTWATYELSGTPPLSTVDLAERLSAVSDATVVPAQAPLDVVVAAIGAHTGSGAFDERSAHAFRRLFGYYDAFGITGNVNVLRWLLGREPSSWEDYCRRSLAAGSTRHSASTAVATD